MTLIDRKQVIKNYVDSANEAFISIIENIIESFEDHKRDIQPFTPEQQKMYDIAISGLNAGDGISHEEMQRKARNIAES